jgi:alkylation response protein AidB-like acyl-CoA dehydrogenase
MTPQVLFDDPDGTLALLRDSVAAFAARNSGTKAMRERRDRGGAFDQSLWHAMADAGWIGLSLPDQIGGAGLGMREQAILSEALGRALVGEPVVLASALVSVLLADAPDSKERTRLAAGLPSGRVVAIPAWKDPTKHSRARPVLARAQGDGFGLDGEKHLVEAARAATDFLVIAVCDDGCILVSIAADAAGLTITERPGIDGAAIATLSFAGCHVPAERLLARAAHCAELLDRPVLHTRLALAAELAGVASKALELAISYTKERVQFGKPIASFQAIQHRLVDMWTDAEFACASVVNAVDTLEAGDDRATLLAVLAAKARAGDAAFSICRRAVHLFGAMGFTDECDIGLYLKRAINLNATLGQPDELRLQFVEQERGMVRRGNNGKQADQDRD